MSLLSELQSLKESDPMNLFDEVSKITEAYCIEHNLPCKRRYTHDELEDAFEAVRAAEMGVYVPGNPFAGAPLAPAEACTEVGATDRPESTAIRP